MHPYARTETLDDNYFEKIAFYDEEDKVTNGSTKKNARHHLQDTEAEDILKSIGIYKERGKDLDVAETSPANRFWLHDTPGAINDAQVWIQNNAVVLFLDMMLRSC